MRSTNNNIIYKCGGIFVCGIIHSQHEPLCKHMTNGNYSCQLNERAGVGLAAHVIEGELPLEVDEQPAVAIKVVVSTAFY